MLYSGNMPKHEDGCVIKSWRCENPSRDEQNSDVEQRKRCRQCPVCKMYYCLNHMEDGNHLRDCNFRSNQEREILENQRNEAAKKEQLRKEEERLKMQRNQEFEKTEKIRRENIAKRNKIYQTGYAG